MKGYELIQKIADGKLATGTKIKVKTEGGYKTTILYEKNGLKWKTGEFDTSILCNRNTEFELDEENKEIEEYKTKYTERCIDIEVRNKINELVRAVNKLSKEEGKIK